MGIVQGVGVNSSTPPESRRTKTEPVEVMSMMAPVLGPSATRWPA